MQRTFLKLSFLLGIGTKILIDTWAASLYIHKYTAVFVASSLHDPWSLMSIRFTLTCHHTSYPARFCPSDSLCLFVSLSLLSILPNCADRLRDTYFCTVGFLGVDPVAMCFRCLLPCCRHWLPVINLVACYFSSMRGSLGFAFGFVVSTCSYYVSLYQVFLLSGSWQKIAWNNFINLGKRARECPAF